MTIKIGQTLFNNGYSLIKNTIPRQRAIDKTYQQFSKEQIKNYLQKLKRLYKETQPSWIFKIEEDLKYIRSLQKGGRREACHIKAYGDSPTRVI